MLFLFVIFLPAFYLFSFLLSAKRQLLIRLAPFTAMPALFLALLFPGQTEIFIPGFLLNTILGLDLIGRVFLFFTSSLWLICGIYATDYFKSQKEATSFFFFYLMALTGNIGLILAHDLVSFYLFFAWMGFAAYGLVVHSATASVFYAGKVYITLVVIGELLIFLGFIIAANAADNLSFKEAAASVVSSPHQNILFILAFLGFGIKAGALPLHVWLPLAHPAAPTPASAVLSGCMIKAGLLGWLRFLPFGYTDFSLWGYFFIGAGLCAAFYAVIIGLTQKEPKGILAYSSISQMGVMTMIAGAGLTAAEMWPLVSVLLLIYATFHAFVKCALFLSVGTASMCIGSSLIGRFGHSFALFIPPLALAGAPFTIGFIAKSWLKKHAIAVMPTMTGITLFMDATSIATALLMGRFLFSVWPRRDDLGVLKKGMYFSWAVVVALILLSPLLIHFSLVSEVVGAYTFLPYKPYEFLPISIAAGVVLLVVWKGWKNPFSIPQGDLLVLYTRVLDTCASIISILITAISREKERLSKLISIKGMSRAIEFDKADKAFESGYLAEFFFFALVIIFFLHFF